MKAYRADLHIHTLLSPCGSLEMSPVNIVRAALDAQLDLIAITDHNSTLQAPLIMELGKKNGLMVIGGAEVNTLEEVHCLCLFGSTVLLSEFQKFLSRHLIKVANRPDSFGEQIVVDEQEMIVAEEPWLLINALDVPMLEVETEVHRLGGLFIPAHIDRPFNGLFSQLGFLPPSLNADAFELSANANCEAWLNSQKLPPNAAVLQNSDAHRPEQVGKGTSLLKMKELSFAELKMALRKQSGRDVNWRTPIA
ncbi:PHP domain-containing protein [Roseimarinus sediminis]|uniref:PHP domain-containing protein n=1 Tax=Roseimarinus sediminis TaxID=1610899 RepID=UPI003D1F90F6